RCIVSISRFCCLPHNISLSLTLFSSFFFFNDTPTTQLYTLSLHDALPISTTRVDDLDRETGNELQRGDNGGHCSERFLVTVAVEDRKSTRLNSSHGSISYAVFCLKKKNR